MQKKKKILITGLGSIGQRYLRLFGEHPDFEIFALRTSRKAVRLTKNEIYTWEDAERLRPWAVLITNPTSMHLETALKCANFGAHLFIEKPLGMTLKMLPALQKVIKRKKLSAYVAYNLRFHPGLIDLKKEVEKRGFWNAQVHYSSWLPEWRTGTDYSRSYSASRKMGGGVLLDLSHEADYVNWIFGPVRKIIGVASKVSKLKIDSEDSVDMIFCLENGAAIPLHLDFCSYNTERSIKVMTKDCFFHLDLVSNTLTRRDNHRESVRSYKIDRDFTYKKQIEYFLAHAGKGKMLNSPGEAANLLSKLLVFRKKSL
ncbi:MAG TPA: hypothetical protein DEQ77_00240 [Candidatus Omnitrophica bacterium]|nr:hypothetical protein [Candidatus Omnitrophota bacterium]